MITGKTLLDLSRIIVGPYASMVLADLGVSVIKVEAPGGDPTRQWGPPWREGEATYFMSVNRNKKSITLNLSTDVGREVLYKLTQKSDAVLENFIPGVTERLKIDYPTLAAINPKLVYCSVSGYGDIGKRSGDPAFDHAVQAEAGFMHLTGAAAGDPFKVGFAVVDVLTGLYASNAVLAGLLHQQQTGRGLHVRTSLFECAVASLINQGSNYLNGGTNPTRMGNFHPNIVPYGLYFCRDSRPVIICVGTQAQFEQLLGYFGVECPEQYRTNEGRVALRKDFDEWLSTLLKGFEVDGLVRDLRALKVPAAQVNNLHLLFESELSEELGLVGSV